MIAGSAGHSPRLFGALPDKLSSCRTGGSRRETREVEFIAGNAERSFSLGPVPIRERTALNVPGDYLVCLAHRVGAELGHEDRARSNGQVARLPSTIDLFSSAVPAMRLLDAKLGRSERVRISEKWPSAS